MQPATRIRILCTLCVAAISAPTAQATIPVILDFQDAVGEGFYDDTPLNDPDVPAATTIGEARQIVVQAAADRLGQFFEPTFPGDVWRVSSSFDPLGGTTIGFAFPETFSEGSTFAGGTAGIAYPAALVNNLAGANVITGSLIGSTYNSDTVFDFDMTGSPTAGEESLFSTVIHEMLHGIGFFGGIAEDGSYENSDATGAGIPTIFDTFQAVGGVSVTSLDMAGRAAALVSDDLFLTGASTSAANALGAGPAKLLAPHLFEQGSTGSHFDRVAFGAIGDLMLPEASSMIDEPIFPSAMDIGSMFDIGWQPMIVPEPSSGWMGLAAFVLISPIRRRREQG